MIEQADEIGCSRHRNSAVPFSFRTLHGGADQPRFSLAGVQRSEQLSGRSDDPAVEGEFVHSDLVNQLLDIGHSHRREQRQRDRQIVMRTVLGQAGRDLALHLDGARFQPEIGNCISKCDHARPFCLFIGQITEFFP